MHFLFQVSSVSQKQYLKKKKSNGNCSERAREGVGLPTGRLICALAT